VQNMQDLQRPHSRCTPRLARVSIANSAWLSNNYPLRGEKPTGWLADTTAIVERAMLRFTSSGWERGWAIPSLAGISEHVLQKAWSGEIVGGPLLSKRHCEV